MVRPNISSNNSTKFVSHKNIGCIKIMIRHMRNIISISTRKMVSVVEALLLLLVRVALSELDKLFAI
jgi:hypothetical protein